MISILGKNTTNPGPFKMIKDACEHNVELGDGIVIYILTKDKDIESDVHQLWKY